MTEKSKVVSRFRKNQEALEPIVPEWPTGDTGASFSGSGASISFDEPAVFVSPDDEVVMVGDASDLEDIPGITLDLDRKATDG